MAAGKAQLPTENRNGGQEDISVAHWEEDGGPYTLRSIFKTPI